MNWKKTLGFLLFNLFLTGFLPTGEQPLSFVTNCWSMTSANSEYAEEQELLSLTNQYRVTQGLAPLALDSALIKIAREQALEMAKQGFISHSEPSGNLSARMDRAGYNYDMARENVARSRTVTYAHSALLKSQAHKDNILATDVTHIGIGVARHSFDCKDYLYITEVFATPREIYETTTVKNLLANRVEEMNQMGEHSLKADSTLETMASRSIDSLDDPQNRDELRGLLSRFSSELKESIDLSRLEVVVQFLRNPRNFKIPATTRRGNSQMYGSAVRQVTDKENHPVFMVLTLIETIR